MSEIEWHFVQGDGSLGPFSQSQMQDRVRARQVTPTTLVWNATMPAWEPAGAHFTGFARNAARAFDGLYPGAPERGFGEAVRVCLRKWVTFRGRASRSEFWFFMLFGMLAGAVASVFDMFIFNSQGVIGLFNPMISLALFIPSLAVAVRRLHDVNRSGWWIGGLYLLILGLAGYTVLAFADKDYSPVVDPDFLITLYTTSLIVMTGYVIVILIFYCLPGMRGPNRFG